ncbi:MAG: hypothetical protein ABIF87_02445 [Pseudomonadota bacterium]
MIAVKQNTIVMRLEDVPEDKVFWCCDGKVLKNLNDLALALKEMTEEIYLSHVNGNKNDFSNWVQDVIGDVTLSHQLKKGKTSFTAARRVRDRLEWLKARA